jgi:serine/threonine-protein kinase HipA
VDAAAVLGLEIARARRARRWPVTELAERAGVSRHTVRAVEDGAPTVAIGTVFELAIIVGVACSGSTVRSCRTSSRGAGTGWRCCPPASASRALPCTTSSDPVSGSAPTEAYVWVWLPGRETPVVAGRLERVDEVVFFNYGQSYLARADAVPLYLPELLTYLLESGSDRIGALDFQASPSDYAPRLGSGTLEEMQTAADRLQAGEELSPELAAALLRGTSIGGARPKVLLDDGGRARIAKLSSTTDPYPVVRAEGVAMELARRVGLDVPRVEVTSCLGRDVLLVDRFDRVDGTGQRRMLVSALTLLGLDEMVGRYATYHALADLVRHRFTDPAATLRELFGRIVFNICVGNTDDHARNHAALWDGTALTLTPAYDLCPQLRSGGEASQAMAIARDGSRASRL